MEKLEEYAQEESPDTETRKLSREPMLEQLTANSSELLQTVKDLKTEMESVKKENEKILKAKEELNQILKEKFQTEGRSKRSKSEEVSHQRRSKKVKLVKTESSSSSKGFKEQQSYYITSDSSEAELYDRKKKYRPYEEISGEFKKIKPPTFNGGD